MKSDSQHTVPSEADINRHDSLDEKQAVRNFLGKSVDQATEMFVVGELHWFNDDLSSMGPNAFIFYIPAISNYVLNDKSSGEEDVFCLAAIILQQLELNPYILNNEQVKSSLNDLVCYVLNNWTKFIEDIQTSYIFEDYINDWHKLRKVTRL